jgi:molybdopterin/thiamine biosynthesis adenylyltransferase
MNLNVIVVGCGGTGSWAVNKLVQEVVGAKDLYGKKKIILMDNDIVEYKNTLRQAFTQGDVSRPKCEVLAERYFPGYSDIEELEMFFIKAYLLDDPERTEHLDQFFTESLSGTFADENTLCVVLSFIDNMKTRKAIHNSFKDCKTPHFIIDAGNEDLYGQVTLTTYDNEESKFFNSYWKIHPEMEKFNDGVKAGPSCADHDELAANADSPEQTANANKVSAFTTVSVFSNVIFGKLGNQYPEIKFKCSIPLKDSPLMFTPIG